MNINLEIIESGKTLEKKLLKAGQNFRLFVHGRNSKRIKRLFERKGFVEQTQNGFKVTAPNGCWEWGCPEFLLFFPESKG